MIRKLILCSIFLNTLIFSSQAMSCVRGETATVVTDCQTVYYPACNGKDFSSGNQCRHNHYECTSGQGPGSGWTYTGYTIVYTPQHTPVNDQSEPECAN